MRIMWISTDLPTTRAANAVVTESRAASNQQASAKAICLQKCRSNRPLNFYWEVFILNYEFWQMVGRKVSSMLSTVSIKNLKQPSTFTIELHRIRINQRYVKKLFSQNNTYLLNICLWNPQHSTSNQRIIQIAQQTQFSCFQKGKKKQEKRLPVQNLEEIFLGKQIGRYVVKE